MGALLRAHLGSGIALPCHAGEASNASLPSPLALRHRQYLFASTSSELGLFPFGPDFLSFWEQK